MSANMHQHTHGDAAAGSGRDWRTVPAIAFVVWIVGCTGGNGESRMAEGTTRATESVPQPTLAQVVHIARSASAAAVRTAELAAARSQRPDVVRYAATVGADQRAMTELLAEAARALMLEPAPHPLSRGFERSGSEAQARLGGLTDRSFDRAYLEHEIARNEALVGVLDRTLLPRALGTELGTLLGNIRPALEAHLRRARQLAIDVEEAPIPAATPSADSAADSVAAG